MKKEGFVAGRVIISRLERLVVVLMILSICAIMGYAGVMPDEDNRGKSSPNHSANNREEIIRLQEKIESLERQLEKVESRVNEKSEGMEKKIEWVDDFDEILSIDRESVRDSINVWKDAILTRLNIYLWIVLGTIFFIGMALKFFGYTMLIKWIKSIIENMTGKLIKSHINKKTVDKQIRSLSKDAIKRIQYEVIEKAQIFADEKLRDKFGDDFINQQVSKIEILAMKKVDEEVISKAEEYVKKELQKRITIEELKTHIRDIVVKESTFTDLVKNTTKDLYELSQVAGENIAQSGTSPKSKKDEIDVLLENAGKQLKVGDYSKAIKLFTDVLSNESSNYLALFGRGLAYREQKQYLRAIDDFSESLKYQPELAESHLEQGKSYLLIKDFAKAREAFSSVIKLNPGYAEAYYQRGVALFMDKSYETSLPDFTRAIEMKYKLEESYFYRGSINLILGGFEKAVFDYSSVLEINPNDFFATNFLCQALVMTHSYSKALEHLNNIEFKNLNESGKFHYLYLKIVILLLLNRDSEITTWRIKFDELNIETVEHVYSVSLVEFMLTTTDLPQEKKQKIQELTDLVKQKQKK